MLKIGCAMTSRERWVGALDHQPLDRLPFWAKLNASYPRAQAAPCAAMSLPDLHTLMGSEPEVGVPACVVKQRTDTQRPITEAAGTRLIEYLGRGGALRCVEHFDPGSQSWHPREFPLHTCAEVEFLADWYRDVTYRLDEGQLAQATERDAAATQCTVTYIGTSPLMDFLQHLAGIDHGQYLLADCPGEVEGLFAAMHANLLRRAELICAHVPADLIYLVENTSTTLLSPAQFRRYCLPVLAEIAAVAAAHHRRLGLHMCGHLQALLPDLDTLPVAAFEAFTSPTVGNTTLPDGRSACPRKCLIGGTNAAIWTRPAREIIAHLQDQLDALPHHRGLVLSSAGVMPPAATPETIKTVVEWIAQYPARW
jgi:hypothetical protein